MKQYSLGLLFSLDEDRVVLLAKRARDPFNPSTWNGVGGHIEEDETPSMAISRECFEEANILVPEHEWTPLGTITDHTTFFVHVFAAMSDLRELQTMTDEEVRSFDRAEASTLSYAHSIREALEVWLLGGSVFLRDHA